MIAQDLTENPLADTGGKITFLASILMNLWNWLSFNHINQFFVILTTLAGLIYAVLKIYSLMLDIRKKKGK